MKNQRKDSEAQAWVEGHATSNVNTPSIRKRNIAEELERDKAKANGDWNDSAASFFEQFKKVGE